jgi:GT2 family glycosyltransferase
LPKFSVIIPSYNHCEDLLRPAVESIIKYTDLNDKEILIVANGCVDGTRTYVESLPEPFKLIWIEEPSGYTKSTNVGIKAAQGEYIILLNNDILLLPQEKDSWIKMLEQPFLDDPKTGIAGPLKLFDRYSNSEVIIFFCAMMKKSLFEEIELLDESFSPGGGEDVDTSIKALKAGYSLVQVPSNNKLDFTNTNTGGFPIFHAGEGTFSEKEIPEYGKTIVKKNGLKNLLKWNRHIKLNIGSGGVDHDGYISVDKNDQRANLILDAEKLDQTFPENKVEEILASHLFEHINPYHATDTLKSWLKILSPGGKLIMELSDFEALCKEFVTADKSTRYGILNCVYGSVNTSGGDPSEITSGHQWGWYPEILSDHLQWAGFTDIKFMPEQIPHPGKNMRVEAKKPGGEIKPVEPTLPKTQIKPGYMGFSGCNDAGISGSKNYAGNKSVSVVISTKNRYFDSLPNTLKALTEQTYKNFDLYIFDDNDEPKNLNEIPVYQELFGKFYGMGIACNILYGAKKGQIFNHQKALEVAKGDWIFRLDDDCSPEPNVLETLVSNISEGVGAIACSILIPGSNYQIMPSWVGFNKMSDIGNGQNCQWYEFSGKKEVEHLYSSFLFNKEDGRKVGYNLQLSKVGHREETMFSNMIYRAGYKLIVDPSAKIWHHRNSSGGIRSYDDNRLYEHDEAIFSEYMKNINENIFDKILIVLHEGLGDCLVFYSLFKDRSDKDKYRIYSWLPDIFEEENIDIKPLTEAINTFGNIEKYSLYKYLTEQAKKGKMFSIKEGYENLYFGGKN